MTAKTEKSHLDIAAETLSGDLRDVMLTHIRSMQDPWSKLSEKKQKDRIYAVTAACETIVRRAVAIIASHDLDKIFCKVSKFTVKDGIKAELTAESSSSNIELIAENLNQPGILIFASPDAFLGQRAPAKAEKDQPDLPIETEEEDDDQAGADEPDAETPEVDPSEAPEAA